MTLTFPVLAISEGKRFTGIWACSNERAYSEGTRSAFDAGCWDHLELVDSAGQVHAVSDARIERYLPGRWWQRFIPDSRLVEISCTLTRRPDTDLASLKARILTIIRNDEEGFSEMRALYHHDDFDEWLAQLERADSVDALLKLFAEETL